MMSTYKYTFNTLPYDAFVDLSAVGTVAETPNVLVVNASSPIHNLRELVVASRAKTGGLNYGTAGLGSPQHLATEQLAQLGKFKLQHISYKGTAPAVSDVMGNQIDFASVSLTAVLPMIESNLVRPIAVLSAKRSLLAPDIPTANESGIPGVDSSVRFLIMAPSKTSATTIAKLNSELNKVLAEPEIKNDFAKLGYETVQSTPDEAGAMLRREYAIWGPVIKSLDLQR